MLRKDGQYFHKSPMFSLLTLCVQGGIRLIIVTWQIAPGPEQSQTLRRGSGEIVPLFLRVGLDWADNVSVGPVLPVKVKSLQQLYPALSGRHTVRKNRLHQLRARRDISKQQQSSDGKPATKPRMHTHSKHFFFSPGLVCDISLLVVKSCSGYVSCSLGQELGFPAGQQLIVIPHIHLLPWKTLQGKTGLKKKKHLTVTKRS